MTWLHRQSAFCWIVLGMVLIGSAWLWLAFMGLASLTNWAALIFVSIVQTRKDFMKKSDLPRLKLDFTDTSLVWHVTYSFCMYSIVIGVPLYFIGIPDRFWFMYIPNAICICLFPFDLFGSARETSDPNFIRGRQTIEIHETTTFVSVSLRREKTSPSEQQES